MKSLVLGAAALLLACLVVSPSHANPWAVYPPVAPDVCGGGGWYNTGPYGMTYGPNYWLRPAWEPFNGFGNPYAAQGGQGGQGGGYPGMPGYGSGNGNGLPQSPLFPSHPYARSPRDYFMLD